MLYALLAALVVAVAALALAVRALRAQVVLAREVRRVHGLLRELVDRLAAAEPGAAEQARGPTAEAPQPEPLPRSEAAARGPRTVH